MTDSRREPNHVVLQSIKDGQIKQFTDDSFQFDFPPMAHFIKQDPKQWQQFLTKFEKKYPAAFNPASLTQKQIYQLRLKCIATVMVCNGLFLAAHACSPEDEAWRNELSLSVMLPFVVGFFDFVWHKDMNSLGLGIMGGTTGYIASALNQSGSSLWFAPAVTVPTVIAACSDHKKIDGWISTAYEKTSKVVNNGINNLFNFWQRNLPRQDTTQQINATQSNNNQVSPSVSSERRLGR